MNSLVMNDNGKIYGFNINSIYQLYLNNNEGKK